MDKYHQTNIKNNSGTPLKVTITEQRLVTNNVSVSNNGIEVELTNEKLNTRSGRVDDGAAIAFDRPNKTEFMTIENSKGEKIAENLEVKKNEAYEINENGQVKSKGVSSRSFNSLSEVRQHKEDQESDDSWCTIQ